MVVMGRTSASAPKFHIRILTENGADVNKLLMTYKKRPNILNFLMIIEIIYLIFIDK